MAEEAEDLQDELEQEQEEQLTEGQIKAMEGGWVPQEQWSGNPDDWVDYKEFNFRGGLMGRISEQSSIIKRLEDKINERDLAIDNLVDLQRKTQENAYKQAMADLKNKKIEALETGDHAAALDIDEEIEELKEQKQKLESTAKPEQQPKQQQQPQQVDPQVASWMQKPENKWFHTDQDKKAMAIGVATRVKANNPNATTIEILNEVDSVMRRSFPQMFTNNQQSVNSGGDVNNSRKTKSKEPGWNDLTEEQQAIARRLEKTANLSRKDYIKELVKAGEL